MIIMTIAECNRSVKIRLMFILRGFVITDLIRNLIRKMFILRGYL